MEGGLWQWWTIGALTGTLLLRIALPRSPRLANILFWVLLVFFTTPIGALLVYVMLSALRITWQPASSQADTER